MMTIWHGSGVDLFDNKQTYLACMKRVLVMEKHFRPTRSEHYWKCGFLDFQEAYWAWPVSNECFRQPSTYWAWHTRRCMSVWQALVLLGIQSIYIWASWPINRLARLELMFLYIGVGFWKPTGQHFIVVNVIETTIRPGSKPYQCEAFVDSYQTYGYDWAMIMLCVDDKI